MRWVVALWVVLMGGVLLLAYYHLYVALAAAISVLSAWVFYHSYYAYRLGRWLDNPQLGQLPHATAQWRVLFDQLSIQEKSRMRRKQQLDQTIQRLNRMMSAIPSAMLILNKRGKIEWRNALADDYFMLTASKLSLKEQVNAPELHTFLDTALHIEPAQHQYSQKLTLGGRTLLLTLIPIEADASMLIAHDISASEQLNISKNTFIANVSHELRTPLTVIQGFVETLQTNQDLDAALQTEFLGLMQQESARMLELIEDLLILSRLENDTPIQASSEPIHLSELISDIVKDAQSLSDTHMITQDIATDVWIYGAYKELYSAFSNLIFNAIRHTEQGAEVHVHLSLHDDIVFFVKDTGEGIDSEHLAHLTERFYRVDKGRSRTTGGSGLGLAIAKHALARHHASLDIDSQVGVGSTFWVRMPKSTLSIGS